MPGINPGRATAFPSFFDSARRTSPFCYWITSSLCPPSALHPPFLPVKLYSVFPFFAKIKFYEPGMAPKNATGSGMLIFSKKAQTFANSATGFRNC
ncbi:MAG: hypothetical protein KDD10_26110 [Phaeodactylibacter sp.]|nr:hypothetical protein [Phaeodactylibacter sp.]